MKNERYQKIVRWLNEAVLSGRGATDPALRSAVEEHAAELGGRLEAGKGELPGSLMPYLEKVARNAYKVTDQDLESLKQRGYSEEAIFEITISAALGAGLGRLERGYAALKGGE